MAKFYIGKIKINGIVRTDLFSDLYWAYKSTNLKDAANEIKANVRGYERTDAQIDSEQRIIGYHTYKPYSSETLFKVVVFDLKEVEEEKVSPHIRGLSIQEDIFDEGDQE